ncbi:MAG: hypothetical protein RLZZ309_857, partial [Bacteroidota bacterium]
YNSYMSERKKLAVIDGKSVFYPPAKHGGQVEAGGNRARS